MVGERDRRGAGGVVPRSLSVREATSITSAITLDRLNLFFLTLGFALHRTPARLMRAFRDAVPPTWGVILQFPFYGAIAAIITDTHLNAKIAGRVHRGRHARPPSLP